MGPLELMLLSMAVGGGTGLFGGILGENQRVDAAKDQNKQALALARAINAENAQKAAMNAQFNQKLLALSPLATSGIGGQLPAMRDQSFSTQHANLQDTAFDPWKILAGLVSGGQQGGNVGQSLALMNMLQGQQPVGQVARQNATGAPTGMFQMPSAAPAQAVPSAAPVQAPVQAQAPVSNFAPPQQPRRGFFDGR